MKKLPNPYDGIRVYKHRAPDGSTSLRMTFNRENREHPIRILNSYGAGPTENGAMLRDYYLLEALCRYVNAGGSARKAHDQTAFFCNEYPSNPVKIPEGFVLIETNQEVDQPQNIFFSERTGECLVITEDCYAEFMDSMELLDQVEHPPSGEEPMLPPEKAKKPKTEADKNPSAGVTVERDVLHEVRFEVIDPESDAEARAEDAVEVPPTPDELAAMGPTMRPLEPLAINLDMEEVAQDYSPDNLAIPSIQAVLDADAAGRVADRDEEITRQHAEALEAATAVATGILNEATTYLPSDAAGRSAAEAALRSFERQVGASREAVVSQIREPENDSPADVQHQESDAAEARDPV